MLILDTLSELQDGSIDLKYYHRGHLSFKSGTQVTVCLLPKSDREDCGNRMAELIVTPINFPSWQHLARVTATLHERQGVIRVLLAALSEQNLNILFQESGSVAHCEHHLLEAIVDANELHKQEATEHDDQRTLAELERRLKAVCFDELVLDGIRPRLKVRPMTALRRAWRTHSELRRDPEARDPIHSHAYIESGKLPLPPAIVERLEQQGLNRTIVLSDTKERLMRVLLPDSDRHFTYVRISHQDMYGALAQITDGLASAFDVVHSLLRLRTHGSRNDIELLLASDEYPAEEDEPTRRAIIEQILSEDRFRTFQTRVAYPTQVSRRIDDDREPKPRGDVAWTPIHGLPEFDPAFNEMNTATILKQRIRTYDTLARSEASVVKQRRLQDKIRAAQALIAQETGAEPYPTVFVSYSFSHVELLNVVKEYLEDPELVTECLVETGHAANNHGPFRDVILERICRAEGFVGIWTPDGDTVPPWLLWELGVAQAFRKPYVLLTDAGVPDSVRLAVNPERQHFTFSQLDFPEAAQAAVTLLLETLVAESGKAVRELGASVV